MHVHHASCCFATLLHFPCSTCASPLTTITVLLTLCQVVDERNSLLEKAPT